jgi:hypothetical protein
MNISLKRALAGMTLAGLIGLLSGCYVAPGYSYVHSNGYAGDAYYGSGPAVVYDYPAYGYPYGYYPYGYYGGVYYSGRGRYWGHDRDHDWHGGGHGWRGGGHGWSGSHGDSDHHRH